MFKLHFRLAQDCIVIGDLPLCSLLLMNDARYPWFLLVPRRADCVEIYQLSTEDQYQLAKESSILGERLMMLFSGDKLNTAALGNVVSQLHVHHVVRYNTDNAWPKPIWGNGEARAYTQAEMEEMQLLSQQLLQEVEARL